MNCYECIVAFFDIILQRLANRNVRMSRVLIPFPVHNTFVQKRNGPRICYLQLAYQFRLQTAAPAATGPESGP